MKTYDFRYKDRGCGSGTHPVVKLANILKNASENAIEVYVLKEDMPIPVLRLFAQMNGLNIKEIEEGSDWIKAILEKKS